MANKDVGLRIRVDRALRQQFLEACKGKDTPAAHVLREFMRNYILSDRKQKNASRPGRITLRTKKRQA
jgi:hypothetical protein